MLHPSQRDASAPPATPHSAREREDEHCHGCGWFDSSHDLRHGLLVHEHTDLAEVSELLPLADWLHLHGAAWQHASAQSAVLWA